MTRSREQAAELRDRTLRLVRAYDGTSAGLGPTRSVSPGGAVTVTVDESGRVAAVELTDAWEDECEYVEDLAGLIMATIQAAGADRLGMLAQGDVDSTDPNEGRVLLEAVRPRRSTRSEVTLNQAVDAIQSGGGLRAMIAGFQATLESALNVTGSGHDPTGRVAATVNYRGEIVGLTIDPAWAAQAATAAIGDACTAAVIEAANDCPHVDQSDIASRTPLGHVARILSQDDGR